MKTAGDLFTFNGDEFSASGLRNGDAITSIMLSSLGTPTGAPVGDYDVTVSSPVGINVANYDITFDTGTFSVALPVFNVTNVGDLAYDEFRRYIDLSETINRLIPPGNAGNSVPTNEPRTRFADEPEEENDEVIIPEIQVSGT